MRTRRHHLPDQVFTDDCRFVSLTCCTCDRRPVFNDTVSSMAVVNALYGLHGVDQRVLAFCVMPDHVHVVVALNRIPPGRFVQAAKSIATRNLRDTGTHTSVWQRGYYDHVIRRRDGLFRSIRYVLLNPVRKGLVDCWWEWPYSGSCQWAEIDDSFLDDRVAQTPVSSTAPIDVARVTRAYTTDDDRVG